MTPFLTIGSIDIYLHPVAPGTEPRQLRERAAVATMIEAVFGPGTSLAHTDTGAPVLPGRPETISVSHSRTTAAIAIDRAGAHPGIDIEDARPQLMRVAGRVLSARELDAYGASADTLAEAWTLKEAAYKCAGTAGLDFRRDIVLPEPGAGFMTAAGMRLDILYSGTVGSEHLALVYRK